MLTPKAATAAAALLCLIARPAVAQNQSLEVVALGSDVYAAIYSEARMDPVEGNSLFVLMQDGVLVLDSGHTPDTARNIIAEIRKRTQKPVRYVVNTHWHDDHVYGNTAYQEEFPGVRIVTHRQTRLDIIEKAIPALKDTGVEYWTKRADDIEAFLKGGKTGGGAPLSAEQKTRLAEQVRVLREFTPKVPSLRPVPADITFDDKLTIHDGDREIQLLHVGLGNTQGDVALYLPKENILAMGDLLVHPIPYAYGSSMREWVTTLKRYRAMNPQVIVPGHGPLMRDFAYLDTVTGLFESLVTQVDGAVKKGLSLDDTRKAVDLAAFRETLAGEDGLRRAMFDDSIMRSAVELAYNAAKAAK